MSAWVKEGAVLVIVFLAYVVLGFWWGIAVLAVGPFAVRFFGAMFAAGWERITQ
jgi:hypothetical protein